MVKGQGFVPDGRGNPSSDERSVFWRYDANPGYTGNINRLNGELVLAQMKQDAHQAVQLFSGRCKRAEPIFYAASGTCRTGHHQTAGRSQ